MKYGASGPYIEDIIAFYNLKLLFSSAQSFLVKGTLIFLIWDHMPFFTEWH
jgi:hypothetical protein